MPRPNRIDLAAFASLAFVAWAASSAAAYDGAVDEGGMLPFVVALQMDGKATCTGVAVNPSTVVTAAHCFTTYSVAQVTVLVDGRRVTSRDFAVHPDYPRDKRTFDPACECKHEASKHDIAVLRVPNAFRGPFPKMLADALPEEVRTELVRTGTMKWGTLRYHLRSRHPAAFEGDDLPAVVAGYGRHASCKPGSKAQGCVLDGKLRYGPHVVTKACLGEYWCIDGRHIHMGDSGGPLLMRAGGGSYFLAGIVHGGYEIGTINHSLASTLSNAPFLRANGAM